MKIDWLAKQRDFLQVAAFCLAIAAILYAFSPDKPYEIQLVYSLAIGTSIWALIDFPRHLFPSAAETGWPRGAAGISLTIGAIIGGYFIGTAVASMWFGHSPWQPGNLRTSVLITLLAGIAGSYYFYSTNKGAWLLREMHEAQRHAGEARLKLLESQLEPHMLFNTLANLRVLIGSDPARAQVMLDHMSAYLRATLDGSRATTHPLQAEFDRLRDYLELMAVRMGPRLAYALELPEPLARQPVPTLLLQPLVENAILHGLEPRVKGGRITVSAEAEDDVLVLTVADTGVGSDSPLAPTAHPGSAGFGLAQVRERLATLYGGGATFEFQSQPQSGARVTLRLPL